MSGPGEIFDALASLRGFSGRLREVMSDPELLAQMRTLPPDEQREHMRSFADMAVSSAAPFRRDVALLWISGEMQELLTAAAETFPSDWRLSLNRLPWPEAFCVFEHELQVGAGIESVDRVGRIVGAGLNADGVPAKAFGWSVGDLLPTDPEDNRGKREGVGCAWYGRLTDVLGPIVYTAWGQGEPALDVYDSPAQGELARLIACLWSMVQQRIAMVSPGFASRAERRRSQRTLGDIPPFMVVRLRRPQSASEVSEHRDVEWSHRWIVDGHWRNQYHPSTNEHVPTWIAPHVKGPADKPLAIKERVYAWTR